MRAHTCEAVGAERVPCGNRNDVQFCKMGSDESADTGAEVKPEIASDQTQQPSHITLQFTPLVASEMASHVCQGRCAKQHSQLAGLSSLTSVVYCSMSWRMEMKWRPFSKWSGVIKGVDGAIHIAGRSIALIKIITTIS